MLTASATATRTAPASTTGTRHDRVHAPTTKASANHGPPASDTDAPRDRFPVTSARTPTTTAATSPRPVASTKAASFERPMDFLELTAPPPSTSAASSRGDDPAPDLSTDL